jgi:hypothetical protein
MISPELGERGGAMSEKHRPFEEPEVVTYARDDLVFETVFTQETRSEGFSDRSLKMRFRSVRPKGTLARLIGVRKPFELPEVVTYNRNELLTETVFTGVPSNGSNSNRTLKREFRPVLAKGILARFVQAL